MFKRLGQNLATVAVAFVVIAASLSASAGGLYTTDRGVRPLGRGGAFVAGADDLGALYYNPAGLVHAPRQVMLDASLMFMNIEYTRVARVRQVNPNTGELTGQAWDRTYPTAKGAPSLLPLPTGAVSYDFGLENAVFALGAWTPYAGVANYKRVVNGVPNPGRYMFLSFEGSTLIVPGVWAAYAFSPKLSVGAGFEMLVGNIIGESAINGGVPDRFMGASEDPNYDFISRMTIGPIFTPSGNIGIQANPLSNLRLGLAFQLPFYITAPTRPQGKIPSAAVFQDAYLSGDDATLKMTFPWIARAGFEAYWDQLRIELAFVYEAWSMHDKATITPTGVAYRGVLTLPDEYVLQQQSVARNFKDTWSVRLGGEASFNVGAYKIDARAGVMYEQSAIPPEYLTTITTDLDKVVLGLGGSFHLSPSWRFDLMVARTFMVPVDVSAEKARFELPTAVRGHDTPSEFRDYVNGGRYKANATLIGVGFVRNY